MLGTVATIAREEGMVSLWKGIVPGLHRQCLFGGLRIGLYEPVSFESISFVHLLLWIFVHLLISHACLTGEDTVCGQGLCWRRSFKQENTCRTYNW